MTTPSLLPERARILIVRLRRLGDLLLLTPALRAIRQTYPNAQIDVLVLEGFHAALLDNPDIDHLIVVRRGQLGWLAAMLACARGRYHAVLDYQSSPRSLWFILAAHAKVRLGWRKRGMRDWVYTRHAPGWDEPIYVARNFVRFAALIGIPSTSDLRLAIAMTAADRQCTEDMFKRAGIDPGRPIIALSVASQVDRKRWPPERYAELADSLIRANLGQLVFTNGPGEIGQVRAVVDRMREKPALWDYGSTTLAGLASIYEHCHLWIGNDGGAKHVATAAGCPTLVIIKAGDERFWTDTTDPSQIAVCDPQPELRDPNSLEGITVMQVLDVATRAIDRLRSTRRVPQR